MGKQEQQLLEQVLRRIDAKERGFGNIIDTVIANARVPERDRDALKGRLQRLVNDEVKKRLQGK